MFSVGNLIYNGNLLSCESDLCTWYKYLLIKLKSGEQITRVIYLAINVFILEHCKQRDSHTETLNNLNRYLCIYIGINRKYTALLPDKIKKK